jgi:hypothetical protein
MLPPPLPRTGGSEIAAARTSRAPRAVCQAYRVQRRLVSPLDAGIADLLDA